MSSIVQTRRKLSNYVINELKSNGLILDNNAFDNHHSSINTSRLPVDIIDLLSYDKEEFVRMCYHKILCRDCTKDEVNNYLKLNKRIFSNVFKKEVINAFLNSDEYKANPVLIKNNVFNSSSFHDEDLNNRFTSFLRLLIKNRN